MAATLEEEKKMIDEAERDLLHTYNRYQVVLDRGDGMYLYDVTGKKYLDFMAGIAVFAFGYNNKEYNDALKAQIDKIIHTSNYFYNEPCIRAAKRLKEISGMDRVFFTNSGAESNEGALKAAMKYAWLKDKDENALVPFHLFYNTVHTFLESPIRRVIDRCQTAADNHDGLEQQDVSVLKLLP